MEVETEEELLYRAAQRELEEERMAQKVHFFSGIRPPLNSRNFHFLVFNRNFACNEKTDTFLVDK